MNTTYVLYRRGPCNHKRSGTQMVVERGPVPKKVTAYSTASKDIGSPAGVYHVFEIHIGIYQSRLSKCCRTHMYVPSNNGGCSPSRALQ
jgi:hypothetical protein